jgi:hypothetical protein
MSWEEATNHIINNSISFTGLCDEDIMKYYIIFQIQIYAFNEMDSGKKDISLDLGFSDGSALTNTDGAFIQAANLAKLSYCYLQTLQEIINNHSKDEQYFNELFKNQLNDYATFQGIEIKNPL